MPKKITQLTEKTMKRKIKFLWRHNFSQIINTIPAEISKKNTKLNYSPCHLGIYIINRCTNKCPMCLCNMTEEEFTWKHQETNDMSLETFKAIIDQFNKAIRVAIGGYGEPFLHKDIFEMIDYAHEKQMRTSIISNGTVLRDKIDRIIKSSLDIISISINATNSDDYKKVCGRQEEGVFETVLNNIGQIVEKKKKRKPRFEVRTTFVCTKSNYQFMPQVVKLASELEVDYLDFLNLIPSGKVGYTKDQCLYEDDHEVKRVLLELKKIKSNNLVINLPKLLPRQVKKRKCRWYFSSIIIDTNGNVGGCGRTIAPHKEYGNVFTDEDVWNNHHFQEMRKMYLDSSIPLHPCCQTCIENA